MTLEVLFAAAAQRRTFLLMTLLGAALGMLVHLNGCLHRASRPLGLAGDLLTAFFFALAGAWILLQSGEGLRLYGLLGLSIGAALYLGGLAPLVNGLARLLRSLRQHIITRGTRT